jgi:putative Holliday junction resolvase
VAVSDPLGIAVRPVRVLPRGADESDAAIVAEVVAELGVQRVVVGLPLLPSGDAGEEAAVVRAFVDTLRAVLVVPVDLWDESFTTLEATARRTARGDRRDARAHPVDAEAAAVILEEWLREHPEAASA